MSDPVTPGRSRRGLLLGVGAAVVVVIVVGVGLLWNGGDPDGSGERDGTDVEATDAGESPGDATEESDRANDGVADADGPVTSAARGAEGTREFAEVPDEIPPGLVPDDAEAIEGTVARGGDDWSAVVVFRTADDQGSLEQAIDTAAEAAAFMRREAVADDERRVIRYDGPDGAVLSVTLRTEGDEQVVGVALVSG